MRPSKSGEASRFPAVLRAALLVLAGLCKSRSDARTNIQQGGVSIDGDVEKNPSRMITEDELRKGFLLRRGKKAYKRVALK